MAIDVRDLPGTVAGKTDEELLAAIHATQGGVDGVLEGMFQLMVERFDAEAAKGQSAVVAYKIGTPEGEREYTLTISEGACTYAQAPAENPKLGTALELYDFLRIGAKEIEPPEAFFAGRLQMSGDLMFARKMTMWFPED